jgi:hypothetical protein
LNASLHELVAEIDLALTKIDAPELRASWAKLVDVLALDPLAELSTCATCGHLGVHAATRCGYCWLKQPTPASVPDLGDSVTLGID